MAKCVVETTAQNMPGVFPLDPNRLTAYRNYAKMLKLPSSADPKKAMEELRNDFGSAQALSDAHNNYSESLMECYSAVISESEKSIKEDDKKQ